MKTEIYISPELAEYRTETEKGFVQSLGGTNGIDDMDKWEGWEPVNEE